MARADYGVKYTILSG